MEVEKLPPVTFTINNKDYVFKADEYIMKVCIE